MIKPSKRAIAIAYILYLPIGLGCILSMPNQSMLRWLAIAIGLALTYLLLRTNENSEIN